MFKKKNLLQETTNPKDVVPHGGLLPLGGVEESGIYNWFTFAILH